MIKFNLNLHLLVSVNTSSCVFSCTVQYRTSTSCILPGKYSVLGLWNGLFLMTVSYVGCWVYKQRQQQRNATSKH